MRYSCLLLSFSVLMVVPGIGLAQISDEPVVLEEVIVTAQRREQNLQETPVALSVLTALQVERNETRHLSDLLNLTAGLSFMGVAPDQTFYGLRGLITTNDAAGTDTSTGVFVDGVYFGQTMLLNTNLSDVERVEVLRGPQGTLWGHNTVAGSINIITRDPGEEFAGEVRATAGNHGRLDMAARIGGALSDDVLGQISIALESTDGFLTNQHTGNNLEQKDILTTRAKLIWNASDATEVRLSGSYETNDSTGHGTVNVAVHQSMSGMSPIVPMPLIMEQPGVVNQRFDSAFDLDTGSLSLTINHVLANGLIFTSQTSTINHSGAHVDYSFFQVPPSLGGPVRDTFTDNASVSQELRLANDPANRLIWQVGAYAYSDESTRIEDWWAGALVPFSFAGVVGGPPFVPGRFEHPQETYLLQTVNTDGRAVFGQATYAATDHFNVTLGGRYTTVTKSTIIDVSGDWSGPFLHEPPGFVVNPSADWSDFSPKLTVDMPFEDVGAFDSLMVYATVANGWKAGGFGQQQTAAAAEIPYEPEEALNYEVGVKTVLANNRANVNVTAFSTDYTNLQVIEIDPEVTGIGIYNADSSIDGFELDLNARLAEWLDVRLAYTKYDSTYDEGSTIAEGQDIGGNETASTPKSTWNAGLNMSWPLQGEASLNTAVNYSFKEQVYFTAGNDRFLIDPSVRKFSERSILNVALAVEWREWEFSVWGRNLLDDIYITAAAPFGGSFVTHIADHAAGDPHWTRAILQGNLGEPRNYGVSIKRTF